MRRLLRLAVQAMALAAFAAILGFFSAAPAWTHLQPGLALVKLSFSHGAPRPECRRLSQAELARLPLNMRAPTVCPRTRPPVLVELRIDGQEMLRATLPPTGLAGDGPSRIYRRFPVPAGAHRLELGLRDHPQTAGFDYHAERVVELRPGQNLVVDFQPTSGGFTFR